MNTDAKFHSLFNVEQSHMFGLWLVIMHDALHCLQFFTFIRLAAQCDS